MTGKGKLLFTIVFAFAVLFPVSVAAEMMTVRILKEQFESGAVGEVAAVAYVNGVFDGMIAMDSLAQKEAGAKPQWCVLEAAKRSGEPVRHPAFQTGEFLRAWEKQGKNMDTIGPDFVLAILDDFYGCKK